MKNLSLILVALMPAHAAHAQITVRSGAGDETAVTVLRDQFRVDLGGGTTAGANGAFGGRRREVNWDGVPALFSAPNALVPNFFNANSPRGMLLAPSAGGTTFQVSSARTDNGAGQPVAANFGNINPSYSAAFQPFSPERLFTALGNSSYEVKFFLPGTNIPAVVSGFGVMFSDVDLASSTSIKLFGPNGEGLEGADALVASSGFSFLGFFTDSGRAEIAKVLISPGNAVAGANDGAGIDVVFADDFIYGEPEISPTIFRDGLE